MSTESATLGVIVDSSALKVAGAVATSLVGAELGEPVHKAFATGFSSAAARVAGGALVGWVVGTSTSGLGEIAAAGVGFSSFVNVSFDVSIGSGGRLESFAATVGISALMPEIVLTVGDAGFVDASGIVPSGDSFSSC